MYRFLLILTEHFSAKEKASNQLHGNFAAGYKYQYAKHTYGLAC